MDTVSLIKLGMFVGFVLVVLWSMGFRAHVTAQVDRDDDGLNDITNLLEIERRKTKTDRRAKRRSPESNGRRSTDK